MEKSRPFFLIPSLFYSQMSCLAVGSLLIATAGGVFMHISIMSLSP